MRTYYANAIEVLAFVPDVPVVLAATKCDDTTRRGGAGAAACGRQNHSIRSHARAHMTLVSASGRLAKPASSLKCGRHGSAFWWWKSV